MMRPHWNDGQGRMDETRFWVAAAAARKNCALLCSSRLVSSGRHSTIARSIPLIDDADGLMQVNQRRTLRHKRRCTETPRRAAQPRIVSGADQHHSCFRQHLSDSVTYLTDMHSYHAEIEEDRVRLEADRDVEHSLAPMQFGTELRDTHRELTHLTPNVDRAVFAFLGKPSSSSANSDRP